MPVEYQRKILPIPAHLVDEVLESELKYHLSKIDDVSFKFSVEPGIGGHKLNQPFTGDEYYAEICYKGNFFSCGLLTNSLVDWNSPNLEELRVKRALVHLLTNVVGPSLIAMIVPFKDIPIKINKANNKQKRVYTMRLQQGW